MSKTFFTSDTHWQHGKIIEFCKRPFKDVHEMDEGMIARWNEVVGPEDTVWHCGDVALGNQKNVASILSRCNGKKHLIWGNHDDRKIISGLGCFETMQDVAEIKVDGERVFLSHFAHRVWNKSYRGTFHVFGHTHAGLSAMGRSIDVGVDNWDFYPVTLDQIKARLTELGEIDRFGLDVERAR